MYHQTSSDESIVIKGIPGYSDTFHQQGAIDVYRNNDDGVLSCIARINAPQPRLNGLFGYHCLIRPDGKTIAVYDAEYKVIHMYSLLGDIVTQLTSLYIPVPPSEVLVTNEEVLFINDRDEIIISFKNTIHGSKVSIDLHFQLRGQYLFYKDWTGWVYVDDKPQMKPKTFFKQ